ncbi:MAG: SDR family oxidoreductase [Actinobacteria bacterium]|nr:SDR family oxidoreductase [Actinomycetota bacterium]
MSDLFSLDGKVALVTGGSRGIGEMIAHGLVDAGAKVYISSRKADACESVVADLRDKGGDAEALPADLSSQQACDDLAARIREREDRLHILVNNAGATWGEPLASYPDSAWDKVLNLNVKAIFHLTRALEGELTAAGSHDDPARVINVGSIDGLRVPAMETYAYSASKAAVHQLTRHLAKRLAAQHITVNAVAPGPFPSKMMAATLDAFEEQIVASTPLSRIGRPDDMGGIAVFLASRAGSYLTGTVIPVDGGISTLA